MAAVGNMSNVKIEPIEVIDDDEDDENELESLRLAALQTIRPKEHSPPRTVPTLQTGKVVPDFHPPPSLPPLVRPTTSRQHHTDSFRQHQTALYRQHQANPNLIAIVPVNTTEIEPVRLPLPMHSINASPVSQRNQPCAMQPQSLSLPQNRYCKSLSNSNAAEESREVPTKFSRIDASDSESDDDILLKKKDSSDEDDNEVDEDNDKDVDKGGGSSDENPEASLAFTELEDEDSLEKLMEVMEQEFSQDKKKTFKSSKKKNVEISKDKVKIKIKQEKVDEVEEKKMREELEPVIVKKEIIDDSLAEDATALDHEELGFSGDLKSSILQPALKEVTSSSHCEIKDFQDESANLRKKSPLDKVTSTAMSSPLRVRSPREVNLKFMQTQIPSDVDKPVRSEKYVYVPIISNNSDCGNYNIDCLESSKNVPDSNSDLILGDDVHVNHSHQSAPVSCHEPLTENVGDLSDIQRRNSSEVDVYRRSRSPRRIRSGELSPIRSLLSPRALPHISPSYISPRRSREHSPYRRSLSPRGRNTEFSSRRSLSPRKYSRSPIPYSASPSPVRRWRSISRSPLRRRSRSRSWTRSRSYSRSRSRSRSPYYRRRSWSSHRSYSRSPGRRSRLSPRKRISPRRGSVSPLREEYSPIRRRFSPGRRRRISISPRRSRSPSYPSEYPGSSTYKPFSPKRSRMSPSPLRMRKPSVSPRRLLSPVRSARVSLSPRRSPIRYNSSPKRTKTSVSPVYRQRQMSLSPRRKTSPIRSRISLSPRKRSFSPRRSPVRTNRSCVSPRRCNFNSPVRRDMRKSLSPSQRHISPKRKSPSPQPRQLHTSRLSPVHFKHSNNKGSYSDNRQKLSPRRLSPFSRQPHSPRRNDSWNLKRTSVSPRRYTSDPKHKKVSASPERFSEVISKRKSVSPVKRQSVSPKRFISPRRNVSPEFTRKSCSPPSLRSPKRKSSPLVVRTADHQRPVQYRDNARSTRPSSHGPARSPNQGLSPVKDNLGERSRQPHVPAAREPVSRKRGSSPQDRYSHHSHNQRRRRNFVDRNNDREVKRNDRNREVRDWNRDRARDGKDREKFREKGRPAIQKDTTKEKERIKNKGDIEDTNQEEKTEDKTVSDPVLEARRRKFESNSPVQPLNKKIRLKTKTVADAVSSKVEPDKPVSVLNKVINKKKRTVIDMRKSSDISVKDKLYQSEQPTKTWRVDPGCRTNSEPDSCTNVSLFKFSLESGTSLVKPDSSCQPNKSEQLSKIKRTDSNKSLDKACNTDDILDLGGDGLLLMDDDYELENETFVEEGRVEKIEKEISSSSKAEMQTEPVKKEIKQAMIKPHVRTTSGVDKACSPLILSKKEELTDDDEKLHDYEDEEEEQDDNEYSRRLKKEMDLRAQLSRRRAERLTKAGSVHESLPKRLLQSAFIGVIDEKKRLDSKDKKLKSHRSSHLQSHVQPAPVVQAVKKDKPVEGRRRVLLLNRSSSSAPSARKATKSAVKISFPKALPESDSRSESEDDEEDDDDDDEEEEDIEEDELEENDEERSMVLKSHKRGRSVLRRLPIHLRLGLSTGRRHKVKFRHRNQV